MIAGGVASSWEPVREAFAEVVRIESAGSSFAVVRDGATVVDLWGGSDPLSGSPWVADSVTLGFSAAKGVVALLAAMEIESGRLDPDARVAEYWPEFGVNGKARITVRDVMTHVAGIPVMPLDGIDSVLDGSALARRLATTVPNYVPRSAYVYHVLSYGVVVAELLRRITGSDVGSLLRDRVSGPLGLSMWIGQPAAVEARYLPALMEPIVGPRPPTCAPSAPYADACYAAFESLAQITDLFERADGAPGTEPMNSIPFRRAQVASGGLVTDALSLAKMYAACVGEVSGVRLLANETMELVSRDHLRGIPAPSCGPDAVPPVTWGLGFERSHVACQMLGEGSFGHAGMGGRLAFAHAPAKLGFAFVGQRMLFPAPGMDPRWRLLLDAVEAVISRD